MQLGCDGNFFPDLIGREKGPQRAGIYQWAGAFTSGKWTTEIKHIKDVSMADLQKYDIVHTNVCGVSLDVVLQTRAALAGSSTKHIINLDYAVEMIQGGFQDLGKFWTVMRDAPFVFAQEPSQAEYLSLFYKNVCGRNVTVPLVPHPCDTKGLKGFYILPGGRKDEIVICGHRYENQVYIPSMICFGLGITTHLIGVIMNPMPSGLFDEVSQFVDWDPYVYWLRHATEALEYYTNVHSQSRFCLETACFGVPTVSTDHASNGARVWPLLQHKVNDYVGMRNDLKRLILDTEFWQQNADYAAKAVEWYGWEPSRERLLSAMRGWGLNI